MDLQANLKYFLTDKVANGKRSFKIVDGTEKLNEAHVFHEGFVKNLGESQGAFEDMGKAALKIHCDWYVKNKKIVKNFFKTKK